jgi:hypothetical protein
MKQSCIQHPPKDRMILIREWQMRACDNNACAAALLSFFEYWHNIKLEQAKQAQLANKVARQHGEEGAQNESLWQWHTEEDLEQGVMIYKRRTIREAIKLLADKKFVTVSDNPNPKYRFDRTKHFLFHPDSVNQWIRSHPAKTPDGAGNTTDCQPAKTPLESGNNAGTIPEITPETSPEKDTDPHLIRFWAMALGSCGDDELARDLDKLQPVSLEDGVLTLRAPLSHIGRRCRQRIGTVRDRLVGAMPVAVTEVRIVSGN